MYFHRVKSLTHVRTEQLITFYFQSVPFCSPTLKIILICLSDTICSVAVVQHQRQIFVVYIYFCVVSGCRLEVDKMCVLLGYYAAYSGNSLSKFRNNILVQPPRVKNLGYLDPYHYMLRKTQKTEHLISFVCVIVIKCQYQQSLFLLM
jgi:hypothetical protein